MRVSVRSNVDSTISWTKRLAASAPEATAKALTFTAQDIRKAEITEIKAVFDRPTPYTLGSVFYTSASANKLQARVWLKNDGGKGTPATAYLAPQVFGGARGLKRFERALQSAGVMPQGWVAIPGKGARLDSYGNMSRGQLVQVLSVLRASSDPSQNQTGRSKTTNRKPRDYFVSGPRVAARLGNGGRLPFGVYERKGRGRIVTILRFRPSAHYTPRFRFFETADRVRAERFPGHLQRAMDRALRSSR